MQEENVDEADLVEEHLTDLANDYDLDEKVVGEFKRQSTKKPMDRKKSRMYDLNKLAINSSIV